MASTASGATCSASAREQLPLDARGPPAPPRSRGRTARAPAQLHAVDAPGVAGRTSSTSQPGVARRGGDPRAHGPGAGDAERRPGEVHGRVRYARAAPGDGALQLGDDGDLRRLRRRASSRSASTRRARAPTCSTGSRRARPRLEAQNEVDDVAQMLEAANASRRRRGAGRAHRGRRRAARSTPTGASSTGAREYRPPASGARRRTRPSAWRACSSSAAAAAARRSPRELVRGRPRRARHDARPGARRGDRRRRRRALRRRPRPHRAR